LRALWLGQKILVLEVPLKEGHSFRGIDVKADLVWAHKFLKGPQKIKSVKNKEFVKHVLIKRESNGEK
ncbi:MAG: hypothetical protein ACK476_18090, partial [Fluviicola sp.]